MILDLIYREFREAIWSSLSCKKSSLNLRSPLPIQTSILPSTTTLKTKVCFLGKLNKKGLWTEKHKAQRVK